MMDPQVIATSLTQMWQRLLKTEVGPEDDFFELGGDSLAAIRMIVEVQSTYRVELDVETFFEAPSIAHLTRVIVARAKAACPGEATPSGSECRAAAVEQEPS